MTYPTLATMRDRSASTSEFRRASDALAPQLCAAALDAMGAADSDSDDIALIPILRAGLTLLPAFTTALPAAPVGFLGIARDEETAIPSLYYENLPANLPKRALILDPMLGTAGSARMAAERLIAAGLSLENIHFAGSPSRPNRSRAPIVSHPPPKHNPSRHRRGTGRPQLHHAGDWGLWR